MSAWATAWRQGHVIWGNYFKWHREWKRHADAHPDRILWIQYEDMVSNPLPIVRKLATFLDSPHISEDEEILHRIIRNSSFDDMCEQGGELGRTHMRKGVTGDWRSHFSKELARSFMEQFATECAGTGLEISLGGGDIIRANDE
jgi:hypothetical protein